MRSSFLILALSLLVTSCDDFGFIPKAADAPIIFTQGRSWEDYGGNCYVENNQIYCWGNNGYPIGFNNYDTNLTPTVVPGLPATKIIGMDACNGRTCVIFEGGSLRCLGNNLDPSVEIFTSGVTKVNVGLGTICAIVNSSLKCWGPNFTGQNGDGTTDPSAIPVDVIGMNTGVTDVSIGLHSVCAVKSGSAYCWGDNSGGSIGNGTTVASLIPLQVSGLTSGVTAIATGHGDIGLMGDYVFAIKNKALYRWGRNGAGQLGNGTILDVLVPELVPELATNVTDVDTGGMTACAVKSGEAWCMGIAQGGLGFADDGLSHGPRKVPGITGEVVQVNTGNQRGCAVTATNIYCWGGNLDNGISAAATLFFDSPQLIYTK